MSVAIRAATEADAGGILAIARELVADGTTYLFAPETTDDGLGAYWLDARARRFVAVVDGDVAGCYLLRPNQPGRGSHVANASYAVARRFAGRGIGRAMGEHSLGEARRLGFTAMQFNFVVSTNEAGIASHLRAHGVREAKVLRDFEAWRKARRSHRRRR